MTLALKRTAIAVSTVACAALFSFTWSEQTGISLSVESAQARVGRPLTPFSVAGVARRQYRRGAYGYGAGMVGAGLVAGAIGAAVVGAASPYGYGYGGGPYVDQGYYGGGYYGGGYPPAYSNDAHPGGYNAPGYGGW